MEENNELPSAFQNLEHLLDFAGGRGRRVPRLLTLTCVPYLFVRSCHFVSVAPSSSLSNRGRRTCDRGPSDEPKEKMMAIPLPPPIDRYIRIENSNDVEALSEC